MLIGICQTGRSRLPGPKLKRRRVKGDRLKAFFHDALQWCADFKARKSDFYTEIHKRRIRLGSLRGGRKKTSDLTLCGIKRPINIKIIFKKKERNLLHLSPSTMLGKVTAQPCLNLFSNTKNSILRKVHKVSAWGMLSSSGSAEFLCSTLTPDVRTLDEDSENQK